MGQQPNEDTRDLASVVTAALESVRLEVVERMTRQQLPLSITEPELVIVDDGAGSWTRGEWMPVQLSGFRDFAVHQEIADSSVQLRLIGLRPQLEPLADFLNQTTDLGTRPFNLLPDASGVEAILVRYATPLAYEYLGNLTDLSTDDPNLIERLTKELEELIRPDAILNTSQLAIEGVWVNSPLEHHRVKMRPLSPSERGRYYRSRNDRLLRPMWDSGSFIVPHRLATVTPAVLLEVTVSRPRTEELSQSTFLNRVALAFYLLGFDIASTGIVVGFDRPAWTTLGQSRQRYLVDEKPTTEKRLMSEEDFHKVVDLAYQMPDFGPNESSSREIALYRTLRGLGVHWEESGFLDFVIALEAALLQGVETELSYHFALYGALFLAAGHDPQQTFEKLKNIYDVRSKLVHGSKITPPKRKRALEEVPELAKAIILKAIQDGWPDRKELDNLALKVR